MNTANQKNETPFEFQVAQEISAIVVQHDSLTKIIDDSIDTAMMMQAARIPTGILIQAEPGMGKSLLLRLIRDAVGQRMQGAMGENRSIKIELDSSVDQVRIAGFFTMAVGYPILPTKARLETMNSMIGKALERMQPVLATIDETQHICEGNRDITARNVTDWIKVRMDTYNFATICAGTLGLEKLCTINPQFTSRASANYTIEPFKYDQQWLSLLKGFVDSSTLMDIGVILQSAARRLHLASNGNLRALKRVLVYASRAAALEGTRVLQMSHLEVGHTKHAGLMSANSNPFRII